MKPLRAVNQVRLGPARAFQLAVGGMRYRPLRSAVTVAVFTLAVAFLAHMMVFSVIAEVVQSTARTELAAYRDLGEHLTRLTTPDSPTSVRAHLVTGDATRLAEIARFAAASPDEMATAREAAVHLAKLVVALERLPPPQRAVVLADQTAAELVDDLREPAAVDAFADRLGRSGARLFDVDLGQVRDIVERALPVEAAVVERALAGHARAVAKLAAAYPGRPLLRVAAEAPPELSARVRDAGFSIDDADVPRLAAFARERGDLERIGAWLLEPEIRARVARETRTPVGDVSLDMVVNTVKSKRRAIWLAELLRSTAGADALDDARILELFAGYRHRAHLAQATASDGAGDQEDLATRTALLILLSFLVCAVGVANAMLMSVTERFTEIATMKCLGGLDGFIMTMFVFEAVVQGAIGGLAGGLVGLLLSLVRGFVEYGPLVGMAWSASGSMLLALLASGLVGVVLAALAAIGPAWVAARLSPMEAMRVD